MKRIALILLASAVGVTAAEDTRLKHPEKLEDLIALFHKAQAGDDAARFEALGHSVIPTRAEMEKIVDPAKAEAFLAKYKYCDVSPKDEAGKKICASLGKGLFKPGRPENNTTRIHAATTEELVAYKEGGVAYKEFPGGMKRFATIAAAGRTWYVVEFTPKENSTGMKYSCFTRHEGRWLFIAKPWRSMPADR